MNKIRLIISSIISIVLVSILLIGSTYSIFTTTEIDEELNVYKTGDLDVTYTLSESNIKFTNSMPMTIEEADGLTPYRITVTNSGNVPYQFDVILTDTTSSSENTIDYQYIMTKVGYLTPKKLSNCTNNIIKEDIILPAGESVDIDVRAWLSDNLSNSEIGKSFYAKLQIDGQAIYNDNTEIDNSILSLKYMKELFPYEFSDFFDEEFNSTEFTINDYFKKEDYYSYIETASFVNYINTTNAVEYWDVSEKEDSSVVAWVENNEEEGFYDLYIGSKYKIYAESLNMFFFNSESNGYLRNIYLDNLDTSLTKNMAFMFSQCDYLEKLDLSNFDTSNVTDMSYMFFWFATDYGIVDLSQFDTSNVTDMSYMFFESYFEELDLRSWDTSNVTNMSGLFSGTGITDIDVKNWNTSNVISMYDMFSACNFSSLDLSSFDTSKVTNMGNMFVGNDNLISLDLSSFDTSNVTNMNGMFGTCKNLTELDLSNFDTSNVTDMSYMFSRNENLISLDLSSFDTSNVTNMSYMFNHCYKLTELDLSKFNTSNVATMYIMFGDCISLTELDLSNFDTSKVTDMRGMFNGCSSLIRLDLSSFDTSNVTTMNGMFKGCSSLTSLDVSNFDTSNVTVMDNMFNNCRNIITNITIRNDSITYYDYTYMFDGAATEEGAKITVNYTNDTSTLVDNMIATKSSNSNVVKGVLVV